MVFVLLHPTKALSSPPETRNKNPLGSSGINYSIVTLPGFHKTLLYYWSLHYILSILLSGWIPGLREFPLSGQPPYHPPTPPHQVLTSTPGFWQCIRLSQKALGTY